MKVERMKWITREIVRANPDKTFLFGDNIEKRGMGGQAKEMRGEPNAVGIPTKWLPSMDDRAFFSDKNYQYNIAEIEKAIRLIQTEIVVIPSDGIGTGLAELDKRAPKTFAYLQGRIAALDE